MCEFRENQLTELETGSRMTSDVRAWLRIPFLKPGDMEKISGIYRGGTWEYLSMNINEKHSVLNTRGLWTRYIYKLRTNLSDTTWKNNQ